MIWIQWSVVVWCVLLWYTYRHYPRVWDMLHLVILGIGLMVVYPFVWWCKGVIRLASGVSMFLGMDSISGWVVFVGMMVIGYLIIDTLLLG